MNGKEIERLLTLIDQNIASNRASLSNEFFRYLEGHKADAVEELRSTGGVTVPTAFGRMRFSLQELQQAAA